MILKISINEVLCTFVIHVPGLIIVYDSSLLSVPTIIPLLQGQDGAKGDRGEDGEQGEAVSDHFPHTSYLIILALMRS